MAQDIWQLKKEFFYFLNLNLGEIFLLQLLHLPFKNRNEIIGILSFQVINFLQFGQNDLPDTTPLSIGSL